MNYGLINATIIGYNTCGIYCIAVNSVSDTNEKYSHCSKIKVIKEMKSFYVHQSTV